MSREKGWWEADSSEKRKQRNRARSKMLEWLFPYVVVLLMVWYVYANTHLSGYNN